MSALAIASPYSQFFDFDGSPLDAGSIYIGALGANPVTSPIQVYWDKEQTQPAAQPLKTINGYIARAGTPAQVFTSTNYSIAVYDKRRKLIYTSLTGQTGGALDLSLELASQDGASSIGTKNEMTVERHLDILYYGSASILDPRFAGGADPTGVADSTAALNAVAQWPGIVKGVHGTFKISAPIKFNNAINLSGPGAGKMTIYNVASTNCFEIGDGANNPHYVDISGMGFDYATQQTISTAAVTIRNGKRCSFRSATFSAKCGICLDLLGGANQYQYSISDLEINEGVAVGIRYGHSSGGALQGVWIEGSVEIYGATVAGQIFHNISGSFINDVDVVRCERGNVFAPAAGQRIIATWFCNVLADSSNGIGWLFDVMAGAAVLECTFAACWASSNGLVTGEAGLQIQGAGAVDGLQFNGGQFYKNYGHGLCILTGSNYSFNGVTSTGNSQASLGVSHGLYINNASSWTVNGGDYGVGGDFTPTQNTGIFIDTNNSGYAVNLPDCTGNLTAAVVDGANRGVVNAIGYTPTNDRGVAVVPIGNSFADVVPPFKGGFSSAEFSVEKRSSYGASGVTEHWCEWLNVNTFRVHTNVPVTGAGFVFAWFLKKSA